MQNANRRKGQVGVPTKNSPIFNQKPIERGNHFIKCGKNRSEKQTNFDPSLPPYINSNQIQVRENKHTEKTVSIYLILGEEKII